MGFLKNAFEFVFGTPEQHAEARAYRQKKEDEERWNNRRIVEVVHRYPKKHKKKKSKGG